MAGLPERVEIVKLALGYVAAQALHAAGKLGIADLLASGPRGIEELVAATHAHCLTRHCFLGGSFMIPTGLTSSVIN